MAENWLAQTGRMRKTVEIADDLRVALVTYQLMGNAYKWWETKNLAKDNAPMTWAEFSKMFLALYYPLIAKEARQQQFMVIEQGNDTMAQYCSRFVNLLPYAPKMLKDEEDKIRHFEWGICPFIVVKWLPNITPVWKR